MDMLSFTSSLAVSVSHQLMLYISNVDKCQSANNQTVNRLALLHLCIINALF